MAQGGDPTLYERFGRHFAAGDLLFREGDPGSEMFVIQSGRVQLTRRVRGRDAVLAVLPPGEFFGEMAIINRRPRNATATVVEDARLLVIDALTFEAMIRGNTEIGLRMIKKLAARLAQVDDQVEVLLLTDSSHRVVHHLRRLSEHGGVADGPGLRIDISTDELAAQIHIDPAEVASCLDKLEKTRLLRKELGSVYIPEPGKLHEFLEFLELKEKFGER
jgi:CRP-like cAMP-binding protein